jgi:thiamine kinase-like enzyme
MENSSKFKKNNFQITIGHIHRTFVKDGLLCQYINTDIFRDPLGMYENLKSVTDHIKKKAEENGMDPERVTLTPVSQEKTADGFIRKVKYIDNTVSIEKSDDKKTLYSAAFGYGEFIKWLSDFPAETLNITIPDFHNTLKRLKDLEKAVRDDPLGLKKNIEYELEYVLSHKEFACDFSEKVPLRAVHNDAKLSNVLFDKDDQEKALAIVDLDTVMPGYAATDFGDLVRSVAKKKTPDGLHTIFDKEAYESVRRGFCDGAGDSLTGPEIESLDYGVINIAYEMAVRYLEDYLLGDPYFRTIRGEAKRSRAIENIEFLKAFIRSS